MASVNDHGRVSRRRPSCGGKETSLLITRRGSKLFCTQQKNMVSFVRHLTWALSSSSACWKNKKPATVVLQLHAQRSRSTFSAISAAVAAKKARAELSASSMPKSEEESSKEVQLISICAKCSDCCFTQAIDSEGEVIAEKDGYVPDFTKMEITLTFRLMFRLARF